MSRKLLPGQTIWHVSCVLTKFQLDSTISSNILLICSQNSKMHIAPGHDCNSVNHSL